MIRRCETKLALPAFFVAVMALLPLTAFAQDGKAVTPTSPTATRAVDAFDLRIEAPDGVRQYLERHLELQRYSKLNDLDNDELTRLLAVSERELRELLATLGYFTPTVRIVAQDTPANPSALRRVTATVQPGEPSRITDVTIDFSGPVSSDAADEGLRGRIRARWPLLPGAIFTQVNWNDAKAQALGELGAARYPLAQVLLSRADIDPDRYSARLSLVLDSGPVYRLGPMQVTGLKRFDAATVQRVARLNMGSDFDQATLLQAQQRLGDSGLFESVFVTLDTTGDPAAAPVLVQVREARLQKLVLGVGASTDSGPRISVEHTHNKLPWLQWHAHSKLALDRDLRTLGGELTSPPDAANWRWVASGQAQRETVGSFKVDSRRLRGGRTESDDRFDRNFYVQYDRASSSDPASSDASAISANHAWTQRHFDSLPFPATGYGLNVQIGVGSTLSNAREPFVRAQLRWLGIMPLTTAGRIALRAEAGAVLARETADIPATQLFVTGGDSSVRGYNYNAIGSTLVDGKTVPGRFLAVGSAEWQRPILTKGLASGWEHTLFVDAGAVSNTPRELRAKVGIGTGARWKSPVGPLQMDLAYAVAEKRLRLHLSVGFTF